jgi:hypothetical protein
MSDDEWADTRDIFHNLNPDYGAIEQRNKAREEQDAYEMAKRRTILEDRQKTIDKEREEHRAKVESERKEREETQRVKDEKRAEYDRLLLSRIEKIKRDEEKLEKTTPFKWIQHLPGVKKWIDDAKRSDYKNILDHIDVTPLPAASELIFPKSPVIIRLTEKNITDYVVGRQYIILCDALNTALKDGLYTFSPNIANNHENINTRRLSSYYRNHVIGKYIQIDVAEGWFMLFQLLLMLVKSIYVKSHSDARNLYELMCKTVKLFRRTANQAMIFVNANLNGNDKSMDELHLLVVLFRVMQNLSGKCESLCTIIEGTCIEMEAFHKDHGEKETEKAHSMRNITRDLIDTCAEFFFDYPENSSVKKLRKIAFGKDLIDPEKIKIEWLDAIKSIPDEVVPWYHPSWISAVEFAGFDSNYPLIHRKEYSRHK